MDTLLSALVPGTIAGLIISKIHRSVSSMARMLHLDTVKTMKHQKHLVNAKILCIALLFLAGTQAFAIIRSPYPAKTRPPYRSQGIFIGDDSILAKPR